MLLPAGRLQLAGDRPPPAALAPSFFSSGVTCQSLKTGDLELWQAFMLGAACTDTALAGRPGRQHATATAIYFAAFTLHTLQVCFKYATCIAHLQGPPYRVRDCREAAV